MEVWENKKCCGNTSHRHEPITHRQVFQQLIRVVSNFHEYFCIVAVVVVVVVVAAAAAAVVVIVVAVTIIQVIDSP